MAYDYDEIFSTINKFILENPMVPLYRLSQRLECSHPIIEKAVYLNTSLCFRDYRKQKLFERVLVRVREGRTAKDISMEIGYKWPEHLCRFIKVYTGRTLMQLKRESRDTLIREQAVPIFPLGTIPNGKR